MKIKEGRVIDERYLTEDFIHASGPGGQHVNKAATAVQLRFDLGSCPGLPAAVKSRLRRLAGRRLTTGNEVVIEARRHRSREQNRREARRRLKKLILRAFRQPRRRRPTRPGRAAVERRLKEKKRQTEKKERRKSHIDGEW